MIKWFIIIALLILLLLFLPKITRAGMQNVIIEDLGTDEKGRKIIKVTGKDGADSGKSVQGYELPGDMKSVIFPLTVVVAPNQKIFDHFGIGEKITVTSRGNAIVWQGTIGDAGGDWIIDYPLLQQSSIGFIETGT